MSLRFTKDELMFTHETFDKDEYIRNIKYSGIICHIHNCNIEPCNIEDFDDDDKYDTGWSCYDMMPSHNITEEND